MLRRKVEKTLIEWANSDYGLLIDGARQIGKTYIIDNFIKNTFKNVITINLYENKKAVNVLTKSLDANDFLLRLSSLVDKPFIPNETVIFIDEVQEFKDFDFITLMKFLIDRKDYRYVISGSLLGVSQYGVDSWPEGYMILEKMYPLDFEEFLWANNVNEELIDIVKNCYKSKTEVPDYIHEKFMDLFKKYLLVGGMPKAVSEYVNKNDLNSVHLAHKTIEQFISKDITKYVNDEYKLLVKEMYKLIPYELNSQSKRFKLSDLQNLKRNDNLSLSFAWFTNSGVAIPTYNANELSLPLILNTDKRLVKLFYMDTGLLTYLLMDPELKSDILNNDININFGSIYENAVAQSLISKGYDNLFYYSKNSVGELDFIISKGNKILPIEVKSGKDYKRHSALNNALNNTSYNKYISEAIVLCNDNVKVINNITYLPVYMSFCI